MKFPLLPLLLVVLAALPARAEQPMSAEAFESYATGKTLYYGFDGTAYGAEEYLPNRRVRWSYLDGKCKDGKWYQDQAGLICFIYDDTPDPQCWSIFQRPDGIAARFENNPTDTTLFEVEESDKPMLCLGPEIGV